MLVLNTNKTKMIDLAKSMGYDPPQNAQFTKAARGEQWCLTWDDDKSSYQAALFAAAGGAVFSMRCKELGSGVPVNWEVRDLSVEDLKKLGLLEERAPKAPTVAPHRDLGYEREL